MLFDLVVVRWSIPGWHLSVLYSFLTRHVVFAQNKILECQPFEQWFLLWYDHQWSPTPRCCLVCLVTPGLCDVYRTGLSVCSWNSHCPWQTEVSKIGHQFLFGYWQHTANLSSHQQFCWWSSCPWEWSCSVGQQSIEGVVCVFQQPLDNLDSTFCLAIAGWKMGAAGDMWEIVLLGKVCKLFRAKLWAIIGPDCFRYPIPREHCLATVNDGLTRSGSQFFDFRKAWEIVYYHQVVLLYSHFSLLSVTWAFSMHFKTFSRFVSCSSWVVPNTNMSSIWHTTPARISFMRRWNTSGALHMPNGSLLKQ